MKRGEQVASPDPGRHAQRVWVAGSSCVDEGPTVQCSFVFLEPKNPQEDTSQLNASEQKCKL